MDEKYQLRLSRHQHKPTPHQEVSQLTIKLVPLLQRQLFAGNLAPWLGMDVVRQQFQVSNA